MRYLWTEDSGAGLHYWKLVNQYLFGGELVVESKQSNQGILNAVEELRPNEDEIYYIAFDIVYDNMDVMNKYLNLKSMIDKYPDNIKLLDITCFEGIILSFSKLIQWTNASRKDKIAIRGDILTAMHHHRINVEEITNQKTRNYLMGFKKYSTERVLKSLTNELTDKDEWSVKGIKMGKCWVENCCSKTDKHCGMDKKMQGREKIMQLLLDNETQRIISEIQM